MNAKGSTRVSAINKSFGRAEKQSLVEITSNDRLIFLELLQQLIFVTYAEKAKLSVTLPVRSLESDKMISISASHRFSVSIESPCETISTNEVIKIKSKAEVENGLVLEMFLTVNRECLVTTDVKKELETLVSKNMSENYGMPDTFFGCCCKFNTLVVEVEDDELINFSLKKPDNRQNSGLNLLPLNDIGMSANVDLSKEHPALAKALTHISQNFREQFTMQELANVCYVSPSHLSSLLKQRFKLSFKKILTRMRIEQAKHLFLTLPSRQVTQICIDVGFLDLSHFEKTFKKYEGMSPGNFRKLNKPEIQTLSIYKS